MVFYLHYSNIISNGWMTLHYFPKKKNISLYLLSQKNYRAFDSVILMLSYSFPHSQCTTLHMSSCSKEPSIWHEYKCKKKLKSARFRNFLSLSSSMHTSLIHARLCRGSVHSCVSLMFFLVLFRVFGNCGQALCGRDCCWDNLFE